MLRVVLRGVVSSDVPKIKEINVVLSRKLLAWCLASSGGRVCVCVCAVSSRVSCVFYLCVSLLGFGGSWFSKGFTVKPRLFSFC